MEFDENNKIQRRKKVPRFRRKYEEKRDIDIDDREAQELIEQDLKSDFIWKTETTNNDEQSLNKIRFDFHLNNEKENFEQKFTNDNEDIEINLNQFDFINSLNKNQQRNHFDFFVDKINDQFQIDFNENFNKKIEFNQIGNDNNDENSIQWTIDDNHQYDQFSSINENQLNLFDLQQEEKEKKNEFNEQFNDQVCFIFLF